ncbi:putative oxidoreductase CzcO [compost metagenome]
MTKNEFVTYLKRYVEVHDLPVRENYKVIKLYRENDQFTIITEYNGQRTQWRANTVVIASGLMNKPKLPELSTKIKQNILQLHASAYKNPEQLPEGNILIVGAGQSGCQIAEELALAGKEVYLASSKVPRAPRRYKGRDVMEWMDLMGIQDSIAQQLHTDAKLNVAQPQSLGMGLLGHTLSYQSIYHLGVTVLGSLKDIANDVFYFADNAKEHIHFADKTSADIKNKIDDFLKKNTEMQFDENMTDLADLPDQHVISACEIEKLKLPVNKVSTIIWATGFGYDFGYMDKSLLHGSNRPVQKDGKIENGLYCIGFPWLRKKKSGLVYGVREDAEIIVKEICKEAGKLNLTKDVPQY